MSDYHESTFRRIIRSHSVRYPLMRSTDLYKLIYQAAMGSAHRVQSINSARELFKEEISSVKSGPVEPVVDIVAHDGSISRINIRPYLQAGFSPEKLIGMFVRTANEFTGSTIKLELYCWWILRMKADDLLSTNIQDIDQYLTEMAESGYPAVHHSSVYRDAYSPSYRVIASIFISELDIIT
ncbi:hypothetical protein DRQ25_07435 [Candidatus Fermentibacteria bacterium]|nr:MAG: hypothetical protein DRQ25_07435 [Candidatus Fermentibacteria bacterium]